MVDHDYGDFDHPIRHQKTDSCIGGDFSEGYTIPVELSGIVDILINPDAVRAICLMKIFDGNKTATDNSGKNTSRNSR